jgi:GTP-binding protein
LLLIDATLGIESQDLSILDLVKKNNKGIVMLVNKWDLVEKDTHSVKEFTRKIKDRIAPFVDIPIIFTSAKTKQRIHKVLETAIEVYRNRAQKFQHQNLMNICWRPIDENPPPSIKGKYIRIKYVTQLPTYSPAFAFFANLPQYVKEPYKRYLENKIA